MIMRRRSAQHAMPLSHTGSRGGVLPGAQDVIIIADADGYAAFRGITVSIRDDCATVGTKTALSTRTRCDSRDAVDRR